MLTLKKTTSLWILKKNVKKKKISRMLDPYFFENTFLIIFSPIPHPNSDHNSDQVKGRPAINFKLKRTLEEAPPSPVNSGQDSGDEKDNAPGKAIAAYGPRQEIN